MKIYLRLHCPTCQAPHILLNCGYLLSASHYYFMLRCIKMHRAVYFLRYDSASTFYKFPTLPENFALLYSIPKGFLYAFMTFHISWWVFPISNIYLV